MRLPYLSQLVLAVLHALVRPLHLSLVVGLLADQSLALLMQLLQLVLTTSIFYSINFTIQIAPSIHNHYSYLLMVYNNLSRTEQNRRIMIIFLRFVKHQKNKNIYNTF